MDQVDDQTLHDEGPGKASGQIRMCIVTRLERDPEDLVRFVCGPDGTIVADLARKLPGRGVWVTLDNAAIATAVKTKAFARGLKRNVAAAVDLPQHVYRLLVQRSIEALAFANKAGLVVSGFEKVSEAIDEGRLVALIHAEDAAEGGRRKLDAKFLAVQAALGKPARVFDSLTVAQMSLAMGRPNVVHAALKSGGSAERLIVEARRLQRYRASTAPPLTSS